MVSCFRPWTMYDIVKTCIFLSAGVRKWLNLWEVFYTDSCYVRDKFKVLPGIYICYACFFNMVNGYLIIVFSPCSIVFFIITTKHYYILCSVVVTRWKDRRSRNWLEDEAAQTSGRMYKNASGSMTYIRDRRRLVPTRASLMNSPIKFDQLNLSWPLFSLSLFLSHSLSFFIIFFLSFFYVHIFLFLLYVPTFFFTIFEFVWQIFFYRYRTCVYIMLCISALVVCHLFILLHVKICWMNVSIKRNKLCLFTLF